MAESQISINDKTPSYAGLIVFIIIVLLIGIVSSTLSVLDLLGVFNNQDEQPSQCPPDNLCEIIAKNVNANNANIKILNTPELANLQKININNFTSTILKVQNGNIDNIVNNITISKGIVGNVDLSNKNVKYNTLILNSIYGTNTNIDYSSINNINIKNVDVVNLNLQTLSNISMTSINISTSILSSTNISFNNLNILNYNTISLTVSNLNTNFISGISNSNIQFLTSTNLSCNNMSFIPEGNISIKTLDVNNISGILQGNNVNSVNTSITGLTLNFVGNVGSFTNITLSDLSFSNCSNQNYTITNNANIERLDTNNFININSVSNITIKDSYIKTLTSPNITYSNITLNNYIVTNATSSNIITDELNFSKRYQSTYPFIFNDNLSKTKTINIIQMDTFVRFAFEPVDWYSPVGLNYSQPYLVNIYMDLNVIPNSNNLDYTINKILFRNQFDQIQNPSLLIGTGFNLFFNNTPNSNFVNGSWTNPPTPINQKNVIFILTNFYNDYTMEFNFDNPIVSINTPKQIILSKYPQTGYDTEIRFFSTNGNTSTNYTFFKLTFICFNVDETLKRIYYMIY